MRTLSSKPQMWYFHVVVPQRMTARNCRAARATRLCAFFMIIRQMKFLTCSMIGVVEVEAIKTPII